MTTLNSFISSVKNNGLARQNRFTVDIGKPAGMSDIYNQLNIVQLFCEQAVLPGIATATVPIRTFGETREMVYDKTFEAITLTFLVDTKMLVKKWFDEWMDVIINPTTKLIGYHDQYAVEMTIRIQDLENNNTYECKLFEAYPKSIQAITLDNNSKDVMKLSVTFVYKNHVNSSLATPQFNSLTDQNLNKINSGITLKQYGETAISMDSTTNQLYYSNFQEYQQKINDNASYSKAIAQLERQGTQVNLGGLFI